MLRRFRKSTEAYAAWLSRKTGDHYRLPSDAECAFAAGSKFGDDALPVDADDPSKRWISCYERESDRDADDNEAHAFGRFGANENGLLDLSGNVWEWTSTRFVRTARNDNGAAFSKNSNYGVRVAEGRHRAYVTEFIRDAPAGGCAAGVPPNNLGFGLVREPNSWVGSLARHFRSRARSEPGFTSPPTVAAENRRSPPGTCRAPAIAGHGRSRR